MRDQEGEARELAEPEAPVPEPKRRRWPPWATALCFFLGGILIGAASFEILAAPRWGEPGRFKVHAGADPDAREEARVAVAASAVRAAPGDWINVSWLVMNTGQSTWAVDVYRFVPEGAGLPVLPLPRSVAPGEEVEVRAVLQVPSEGSLWEAAWRLTGRRGQVGGGALRLRVSALEPH